MDIYNKPIDIKAKTQCLYEGVPRDVNQLIYYVCIKMLGPVIIVIAKCCQVISY